MKVIRRVDELREWRQAQAGSCVLVPTMGALHQGHLSLMALAREEAGEQGTVMASIFVNPIQFDRKNDLEAYPRNEDQDLRACEAAGVNVVFVPDASEMYAADRSVTVSESTLSKTLCGASRPGHFDGVCTVCLKLFLMTGCNAAVFGEKDFQQLAIIRRMVRDLNLPLKIIAHPTIREADGLAMSSRNARLTDEQRADAPRMQRALREAASLNGVSSILEHTRKEISGSTLAEIDYIELVDADSLAPAVNLSRPTVLAVAVFYGGVRLIDHVAVEAQ